MFEDTNQTPNSIETQTEEQVTGEQEDIHSGEADDLEDVFSEPSEEEEPTEKPQAEPTAQEEQPRPDTKDEAISLKFLGREIALDRSAAQSVAQSLGIPLEQIGATLQKGLNYDHALQAARSTPERKLLEDYAQLNGMSRQEYLRMLESQRDNALVTRELDRLRGRYPDAPEELLNQLAKQGLETRRQEETQRIRREAQQQEARRRQPWVEFFERYPDLKAGELPQEIYRQVEAGMSPTAAWLDYQNGLLQRQLAAAKQNQKNRQLTIGSAKDQGEPVEGDLFLEGFDSVFR